MTRETTFIATTAATLILSAGIASAQTETNPETMPNNSWASVSGIVASAGADSFQLDYGEGLITVEMDDWDWYAEAAPLLEGDNVIVYGIIDDDMMETESIEASSVYVKGLGSYFYANGSDEEDLVYSAVTEPKLAAAIDVTGTVEAVDGRNFTIDIGSKDLSVSTSEMTYNPLDDEGFQKVEVDDRVKVTGKMDYALFEANEIEATTVVTLVEDATKQSS